MGYIQSSGIVVALIMDLCALVTGLTLWQWKMGMWLYIRQVLWLVVSHLCLTIRNDSFLNDKSSLVVTVWYLGNVIQ